MSRMLKIDWRGFGTTKGRMIYATTLGLNFIHLRAINYKTGFIVGWDKWSDGSLDFSLLDFSVDRPVR